MAVSGIDTASSVFYNPYQNSASKSEGVSQNSSDDLQQTSTKISSDVADIEESSTSESNNSTETPQSQTSENEEELTQDEKAQVNKLVARDSEVRAHEAAHLAAGGGVVTGGASFTYQSGPDGKQYAIGGEVPIDISEGDTPEATISKMQQVRAAAMAPASPSPQDYSVASTAAMIELKARAEIAQERVEELSKETKQKEAISAYEENQYNI